MSRFKKGDFYEENHKEGYHFLHCNYFGDGAGCMKTNENVAKNEKAYREMAWDYTVESDISFGQNDMKLDIYKNTIPEMVSGVLIRRIIEFSISYNDCEGGERQHQVGWTGGKSSDRSTLGTLYFK